MNKTFPSPIDELQEKAKFIYRMNFYLWMYIAQEGNFEEAQDFLTEHYGLPTPFESFLFANYLPICEDHMMDEDDLF